MEFWNLLMVMAAILLPLWLAWLLLVRGDRRRPPHHDDPRRGL